MGVEVEVEFVELYRGQPLFGQVDEFLRSCGFSLFDLSRSWWKRRVADCTPNARGQLIHADALYLRDYVAESDALQRSDLAQRGNRMIKAIAISIVYDKLDFAMELVPFATQRGHLTTHEAQELTSLISAHSNILAKISNFRGRGRLEAWLRRLADDLTPDAWSRSDT